MIKVYKQFVKAHFPLAVNLWRRTKYFLLDRRAPRQLFNEFYSANSWGDGGSISGPGSNLVQTEAVRRRLPRLIREIECRSMLDIPCGDFNWMRDVELNIDYIGGDIVDDLVKKNQQRYGSSNKRFVNLDLLEDELPRVDLVLCRDCLIHFSFRNIRRAIRNIKASESTYLLTTTYVGREKNEDIPTGAWRPINLQRPPFNFSKPIQLLDEECPRENYRDKSLGLWKIQDLPDL